MTSNYFPLMNSPKSKLFKVEKQMKISYSSESTPETQDNSFNNDIIPTVFEWKERANIVFLTGSFCNWKKMFKMIKINNTFQLIIVK